MARHTCFLLCSIVFFSALYTNYAVAEPQTGITTSVSISHDKKLKRQNNVGGEEIDLSRIPDTVQTNQPGQPGITGAPQQPGSAGQNPFFGNANPFFQQQPFFGNGFSYPGLQQGGFPQGIPQGSFPQGFPQTGFAQGFPQGGFPQQLGGTTGSNVILNNNGKQYLVQPLTGNQRVVEKNGKQYLLQPLTAGNAALTNGNFNGANLIPQFNVPNAALAGLSYPYAQNSPLTSVNPASNPSFLASLGIRSGVLNVGGVNPGISGSNAALTAAQGFSQANAIYPPYSPAVASVQPSALASTNSKLVSSAPQRVIVGRNGQKLEVEPIPITNGQGNPYLATAVGAVSAQLAQQHAAQTGQQYAYHYVPLGLNSGGLLDAYSRANQAGYGQYPTKREVPKQSKK